MRRSLLAAGALIGAVAFAQERGRLVAVRAGGDAADSIVELVGDRPLSFTTLKLRSPPRVVVDFAETDLALPVRDLMVEDGTIRRVAAAPAGQKTARVVIELAGDAEFAVRAQASTVEVRVPRLAPLLAGTEPPAVPPRAGSRVEPPGTSGAQANGAAADPGGTPTVDAGGGKRADDASPETESQRRASLPTVALVGSRAAPPATPESAAERKRRGTEERVAAYAAAQREAAEKAGAAQKAARQRTLSAAEEAPAGPRAQNATAGAAAQNVTAGQRAAARSAPGAQEARSAAPPRRAITGVGFRPVGDGAVIIRSDQPLEYDIGVEGNTVVLHLASAGIPLPNNRRPLDTRFFNGPVQRVVPLAVDGGTDLRIELSKRADYQLTQSGSVLTVTFSVPR